MSGLCDLPTKGPVVMRLDWNEPVALRLQRLLPQQRNHRPRAVEDVFAGRTRVRCHLFPPGLAHFSIGRS